jgi:hypothetical protein
MHPYAWFRIAFVAAACAAAAVVAVAPVGAAPRSACASSDYSYAGIQTPAAVAGIGATITAVASPAVAWGHIGGWIGVGGPGQGPNGTDAWVQVGLSSFADDKGSRIYYEIALPYTKPRYVEVDTHVAVGEAHRLAIEELSGGRGWWHVFVDGQPVGPPVHVAGSNKRWKGQAFGESWNGGQGVCNRFDYRFAGVRTAERTGSWAPLAGAQLVQDTAYRVTRLPQASFRARFAG